MIGERAARLNDVLSHGGFRRSQSIAYRPACESCKACVSVRVPVADFDWTKSFRRNLRDNSDVVSDMRAATPTSEQYSTFRAYLDLRHADGGMADMTVLDYAMWSRHPLNASWWNTVRATTCRSIAMAKSRSSASP